MQRRQEAPERALPRQTPHLQHPGQHRIVGHIANVIEAAKPNVDGQHHPQHELIDGHDARNSLHRQRFLDQLLEPQLLQHRRHRKQTTVGSEILAAEVERGGTRNFIGLRNTYGRALPGAGFIAMLLFVLHRLGDLLEIGSRSAHFAAFLFYNRISRVPKGFASSPSLHQYQIPCIHRVTVIRSWLGHAHLDTTNLYAEANIETQRKALEKADPRLRNSKRPRWKRDADLLAWLDSL